MMKLEEQLYNYLVEMGEETATDIMKESEVIEICEDVIIGEFDEWDICTFQILIKGQYLKLIDKEYSSEKTLIEDSLTKIAETKKKTARYISWHPLPPISSEIKKINQNDKMIKNLIEEKFDDFFKDIQSIFASVPYNMNVKESYFHSQIHTLLKTLGFEIISEDATNLGRVDSVIELDKKIIIIEFKTSNSELALKQIKEKKYSQKYRLKKKEIFLIGVECNTKKRNITDWKVEKDK